MLDLETGDALLPSPPANFHANGDVSSSVETKEKGDRRMWHVFHVVSKDSFDTTYIVSYV